MKTKNFRPNIISTMHSKKHRLVAISFVSSDKEYIIELPIIDGKKLVMGLADSIRKCEAPSLSSEEE